MALSNLNVSTITNNEIEKDIINALKHPPKIQKKSSKIVTIISVIIAVGLVMVEIFYREIALWVLLGIFACLLVGIVFTYLRLMIQIKKVSISDYDITTEVVKSISEEHFKVRRAGAGARRRYDRINNYNIHFENGESWRVPKDNYLWSEERPMSDFAIFQSTHRGDVMTVVTKKDTKKIVMAYHNDLFEYKN